LESSAEANLEPIWRDWAKNEEALRIVQALHVHDAEFATMFHDEPFLRHEPRKLLPPCADDLFLASSAKEWVFVARCSAHQVSSYGGTGHIPQPLGNRSSIYNYTLLAGILASIAEADCEGTRERDGDLYRRQLTAWYMDRPVHPAEQSHDVLCMSILWHEAFMALYVSFDLLDRVVGRDGQAARDKDKESVGAWVRELSGKRCVVHALLLFKYAQSMPLSVEPALHVPKALFYAGIVIFCHVSFRSSDASSSTVAVPELQCMAGHTMATTAMSNMTEPDWSVLHDISDLLSRQGHWELSRRFASILQVLIDSVMDP
jgi:hypothetical protein